MTYTVQRSVSGAGLGLRRGMFPMLDALRDGDVDFMEIAPENWIGRRSLGNYIGYSVWLAGVIILGLAAGGFFVKGVPKRKRELILRPNYRYRLYKGADTWIHERV